MVSARSGADPAQRVDAVLFDLLMAVMNSLAIWSEAAGDEQQRDRQRAAAAEAGRAWHHASSY